MYKLVCISDIHGNYAALEAVLQAAEKHKPDRIAVLGDLVAFGPQPGKVVERLSSLTDATVIRGNTDRYVLECPAAESTPMWDFLDWTRNSLSESHLNYLKSLDPTHSFDAKGVRVLLCHATPSRDDDGFHLKQEESFPEKLAQTDASLVLCGHTHRPMVRRIGNQVLVNDGSVGFPYDGTPKASMAVITLDRGQIADVAIERVDYDKTETSAQLAAIGLEMAESMSQRVLQGIQIGAFR